VLVIAILALGCGGNRADTRSPGAGGGDGATAEHPAGEGAGGDMVPPEKMDEVARSLERKRSVMPRCLAIAVDAGELPKNARGKVTLEIVVSPAGRADSVKVVRASLESRSLDDCIIGHVKEIQFPELPRPYETSFTYGFEAM
jgi:hypothetical protein